MSWMEDLVLAAGRHGVPCVVIGGNGNGVAAEDPEFVGRYEDPPGDDSEGGDPSEVAQLRAQVQQLTAEASAHATELANLRRAAPASAPSQVPVETPTGDNGSYRDQPTDTLGLDDEKLTNKLIRLGYDTVGKVADAYDGKKLIEAKLKKDWLNAVGMAICGMFARAGAPAPGGAPAAPGGAGGEGAMDVPEGHTDRPWTLRLGLARDKQKELNGHQEALAQARAAYEARVKAVTKAKGDPDEDEEVDTICEKIMELEEDIKVVTAHCVALKWCLGLNPLPPERSLDDALLEANLGPWMESPQPRMLAGAGA